MGGEYWLQLGSGTEADRLRSYLGDLEEFGVEGRFGWWFNWSKRRQFEIGYSFGALSSEGACLVAREIAKRFQITRVGTDSEGWYSDKGLEHLRPAWKARYGEFFSWVDWVKAYKIEWMHTYRIAVKHNEGVPPDLKEMEDWIVKHFEELDRQAAR